MKTTSFEDLLFWKKAHELTLEIYKTTSSFPKEEKFGITDQLRRSSSSVPANIAEGYSRQTTPDKLKFFNIVHSSLEECRYFLILSRDLNLLSNYEKLNNKALEIKRMMGAYTKGIKSK